MRSSMLMHWIKLEIVAKDKINMTWDPELESVGYTQMKLVEDVTDGKAHIGVLQANENFANTVSEDGSEIGEIKELSNS